MKQILLVDDEDEVRKVCAAMIQKLGHEVTQACNGTEAREKLEHAAYDLVITDLFMPDGDGFDVIKDYRKIQKDGLIIAMSGGGRVVANDLLKAAKHMGAVQTLAKPFSKDELATAISVALLHQV
ncbi:MAG: response regulator [Verrucomicrobiales bacterium]